MSNAVRDSYIKGSKDALNWLIRELEQEANAYPNEDTKGGIWVAIEVIKDAIEIADNAITNG